MITDIKLSKCIILRPLKFFFLFVLSFSIYGCGEMLPAMSQATQDMGSSCKYGQTSMYIYHQGEWLENKVKSISKTGKDVTAVEKSWLNNRRDYFLNRYQFKTYHVTSPHSGAEYKFNVYCAQWN